LGEKDLSTLGALAIAFGALVEFSSKIHGSASKKLVTLGFLEP
jgi:hypothetical protein